MSSCLRYDYLQPGCNIFQKPHVCRGTIETLQPVRIFKVDHCLKTLSFFKAKLYCYLSTFLLMMADFGCMRLSGHCGISL